jgi:hypothetical protein
MLADFGRARGGGVGCDVARISIRPMVTLIVAQRPAWESTETAGTREGLERRL